MSSVLIVGGGISGLSVAWWLHRARVQVTVLERSSVPGGTMQTVSDGGWLVETGPNSALETTPLFDRMFSDLGIIGERLYPDSRASRRYILRNGTLHPIPMSPGAFLRTPLWTPGGKLRLLKEPFVGRGEREETIAEFVERRLGREFLDYAINPFVAGVYAGNPEQLSVRAAFPKLYSLEEQYGGLIRGMILGRRERKKRAEKAKDRARLFSFTRGMRTFPEAIARGLAGGLVTGAEVQSLEKSARNGGYMVTVPEKGGSPVTADAVVLSVPAPVAARLTAPLDPSLSRLLAGIFYPPVAEVVLGYGADRIGRPLDGFGFLVPAREKRGILGTIWSSALFPGRAPDGHEVLTTFVGGSRQPELTERDDRDLAGLVASELGEIMGVRGEPAFRRIVRWERAIPQYNLGYGSVIAAIEQCEKLHPGLFFCSNYRGGIAVGDCIMSAERTAQAVLRHLGHSSAH